MQLSIDISVLLLQMKTEEFTTKILPLKNNLLRVAYRITGNAEEAEDVVQEVMLKMWSQRDSWDTIDSLPAYCMMMSRNLALDRIRHWRSHEEEVTDDQLAIVSDATPFSEVAYNDQREWVLRLLETLPDLHRKMIQLREEEELIYAEIAGVLNITESKVKSDLFRIRQYLKQAFEKVNSYGLRNDK